MSLPSTDKSVDQHLAKYGNLNSFLPSSLSNNGKSSGRGKAEQMRGHSRDVDGDLVASTLLARTSSLCM